MYRIGESKGINLYAPRDAYFSYFNSPYFSHSHASAIDIYPAHREWGGPVLSPISGKLVRIQKTSMGRKKDFPTEDYDFGMAIQPKYSDENIVRILHCNPTLKIDDRVEKGDIIGTTLRSRYFNYWTGPHYHIEVMHKDSFRRSTRSYPLKIPFRYQERKVTGVKTETEFLVSSVSKDNIIGYPTEFLHAEIGGYNGLAAMDADSKTLGILDGGISHYRHGGVVGHEKESVGSIIHLQNIPIGTVQQSMNYASFFQRNTSVLSYLNGILLRGLSCFIYPKQYTKKGVSPLVLVPKVYDEFTNSIAENEVLILKFESDINTIIAK